MSENLQKILDIFYQICKIPHPSGKTQKLREFLIDFLRACECEVKSDSAGNIHALKGAPKLVFQAHYDMVLVGEKIEPFIENGFLKSRNSSLGADNGAAVATLLHLAKTRKNIEILLTNDEEIGMLGAKNLALQTHSKKMINLDSECVEEICVGCAGGFDADIDLGNLSWGMQFRTCEKFWESADSGLALSQNFSQIQKPHRHYFDCDSQSESTKNQAKNAESSKNISSLRADSQNLRGNPQGFARAVARSNHPPIKKTQNLQGGLPRATSRARNDDLFYEFSAQNFKGGHSGIDIDKNIKNAIVELLFALDSARQMGEFEILEISGGEARNSIPINARAIIRTKTKIKQISDSALTTQDSVITIQEVNSSIFDEKLGLRSCEREDRTNGSSTKRTASLPDLSQKDAEFTLKSAVVPYLLRLHNGIYEMEQGSVTSSLNFSIISNEVLKIMVRGNKAECLDRQILRLKYLFGEAVKISGFYNAWEANSSCGRLNSSLGASCGDLADFGHCADSSLALRPKSAKNSTTSTANTRICDLDSANQNNLSLRANPQDLRGNPPIEKTQNPQRGWLLRNARKSFGLPRSHSLARNDEIFLDSSLRKCSAQNDKLGFAESSAESTLLSTLSCIYTKHKIPFKIIQIHAGLECGILKDKCALDEVISIGPTILHPHSKGEMMDLASFGRFCAIVEDLCEA